MSAASRSSAARRRANKGKKEGWGLTAPALLLLASYQHLVMKDQPSPAVLPPASGLPALSLIPVITVAVYHVQRARIVFVES